MLANLLRLLDILVIFLALIAGYSLWVDESSLLSIILIVLSPALLLFSKYKRNRILLFIAYVTTTVYFTSIIYNGLSANSTEFFREDFSILSLGIFAIVISAVAAVVGFGTNTLTILWFTLQCIVLFETMMHYPMQQFSQYFWSNPVMNDVIQNDYPILLMVVWIGLFLDKYQRELIRDYLSR